MGSKAGSASKVKLSSFDDLFGGAENTAGEQIINAKQQIYIRSKDTRSVSLTMKKWRKRQRASASTVCLCRGLQDREKRAAMRS